MARDLLSAAEAASMLRTSTSTIRRLARGGELRFERLREHGQRRYLREDVVALKERSRERASV